MKASILAKARQIVSIATSAVSSREERDGARFTSLGGRLVHGLSWQVVTNVLGRIGTFAIAIIQARILGKTGYGELGMVLSTLSLFGLISGAAGGSTCTKFIAERRRTDPVQAGRIAALSVVITLLVSILPIIAMFFFGSSISAKTLRAPQLLGPLWLGAFALAFLALTGTSSGMLTGLHEFKLDGQLRLVQIFTWLPLTAWLAPKLGVYGAMLAYALSQAVGFSAYCLATVRTFRRVGFDLRFRGMWTESHVLVRFSLPYLLHGLLIVPTVWVCNAILARQPDGYTALGGYTAAFQFRTVVLQFPILIQGVVWPTLVELYGARKLDKLATLYQNTFEVLWAVGLVAALAMISFGGGVMGVFGRSFTADASVMDLVMAITSLSLMSLFAGLVLQILDKTWPALVANIGYFVISICCSLLLVPRYGAYGLATAFIISTFIQAISLLFLVRLYFPYLHQLKNFGLAGLSLAMCLAAQFAPIVTHWLLLRVLVTIACMGFVCWLGLVRPSMNLIRSLRSAQMSDASLYG